MQRSREMLNWNAIHELSLLLYREKDYSNFVGLAKDAIAKYTEEHVFTTDAWAAQQENIRLRAEVAALRAQPVRGCTSFPNCRHESCSP